MLQKGLMVQTNLPLPPNPLPVWYNPNVHYEFHEGVACHDLEGLYALKARVQDLVKGNILSFKDVGPNVKKNTQPSHSGPTINAIEEEVIFD